MGSTQAAIVTFLFTDLVGSTATLEELGEDDFDRARRAHFRLLRDRVSAAGGDEVKSLGDGLMAVFASAVDAVRCAVEIQRAVAVADGPMGVRVGLHVGDPIREDDDYFGRSVVVARRLCDSAGAAEIRASALVRELVGTRGGFEFTPLGDVALKGLATPVTAFRVETARRDRVVELPSVLAWAAAEPFVGRDDVVEDLEHTWKRAADGGARLALVAGEPGIGKTRLAARLARAVADAGGTVLYGRCDEDNLVAYQPFVEGLQHLLHGMSEGELTETLGDDLRDLARLLPDLARRYGIDFGPAGDAETERYLMFEAVARLLSGLGRRAPTLVVLDDLHWSDAPTLRLLRHLVQHPEPLRALILGTYRDTDLDRTHPLAGVLADLRREPLATRVVLDGLSSEQIAALLEEMGGQPVDERGRELAGVLRRETDGNPFFVREVVRHLVETGTIYQREGQWTSDVAVERAGIPEGVREVIGRRLSRLDEGTNRVLAAASVVGREFDTGLVAHLVSLSEDDVIDLLEAARAAALVAEVPGAVDRYAFTHALVRQALYAELATSRRVRLHRRAAEAIEAAGGDGDPPLFELARHYLEAGELSFDKAVEYAQKAAAEAMRSLAYEEAARLIGRVLDAVDPDDLPPRVRSVLLTRLGEARAAGGDVAGAVEAFAAGVEVARSVDDPELFARSVLAAVGPAEASVLRTAGRELLLEAQDRLPPVPSPLRARVLARRAAAYATPSPEGEPQEPDTAQALAEEALEMARSLGDVATLGDVARSNMYVVAFGGQFAEPRRAAADELARLARESDDPDLALTALGWQFGSALAFGDIERAERHLADYQTGAERLRRPVDRYYGLVWEQVLALFRGEFDRATELQAEAFGLATAIGHPAALANYAVAEFLLRRARGGLEELLPAVEAVIDEYAGITSWRCSLAYLFAEIGRSEEARQVLGELDVEALAHDPLAHLNVALLAQIAHLLGEPLLARQVLPYLEERGRLNVTIGINGCLGSNQLFVGFASATAGDLDRALAAFADAADANDRMGAAPWRAEAQVALAQTLVARDRPGDVERAAGLAAAARATCVELGMPRLAERARRITEAPPRAGSPS